MNKEELVKAAAAKAGMTQADIAKALKATLEVFTETFTKGEKVALVGFGTFNVRQRKARKGVNPANRKPIQIPARKAVVFSTGKLLKNTINGIKPEKKTKKVVKKAKK